MRSDYERARRYLEEFGPLTVEEFKQRYFNEPLYRVKGQEWTRAGLIRGEEPGVRREVSEKPHTAVVVERKVRRPRTQVFKDKLGRTHRRDIKTGRFIHFGRVVKPSPKVKKRRPARVKKGPSPR